ncbi:MAG: cell division FtsA domain-containing protein [Deltaproteobacteria bacterium]|nr:cell division FtsA domain-containing protein [Deltaproteobacteria bacterium]
MAVSIDIGTCWLCSARQGANNQIQVKSIRDAFLDVESDSAVKNMLTMSNVDYIESEDKLYIIGENALVMARILNREVRRPMSKGVLAPGELEAEKILLILLENVMGRAQTPDEICFYSIPGNPLERELDIIYHQAMMSKLLAQLGYKGQAMNESAAIAYSSAAKEQFSALTISAGAGMMNVCLMYKTMIGLSYSIINSGDWVDESAAKAVGSSAVRIQALKEKGIDLMNPSDGDPKTLREREAISIYYKSLILRLFDSLKDEFIKNKKADFELPNAIPMIIAGGTSMAKNFLEFFKTAFDTVKDKFPIPISEIRMSSGSSPLHSVAEGLLVAALNYEDQHKK